MITITLINYNTITLINQCKIYSMKLLLLKTIRNWLALFKKEKKKYSTSSRSKDEFINPI